MKITRVEALYLRQPEVKLQCDSGQDALIVRVETDAGITGIGEVDSSPMAVKGAIEGLKRIDDKRVTITGWAVDKTASSSSLTIVAFAGGRNAMTTVTNGARKDVAQMFGLSDASARSVSFEATLACGPGQSLVVVAVTADRTYSQFRSLACPLCVLGARDFALVVGSFKGIFVTHPARARGDS